MQRQAKLIAYLKSNQLQQLASQVLMIKLNTLKIEFRVVYSCKFSCHLNSNCIVSTFYLLNNDITTTCDFSLAMLSWLYKHSELAISIKLPNINVRKIYVFYNDDYAVN